MRHGYEVLSLAEVDRSGMYLLIVLGPVLGLGCIGLLVGLKGKKSS